VAQLATLEQNPIGSTLKRCIALLQRFESHASHRDAVVTSAYMHRSTYVVAKETLKIPSLKSGIRNLIGSYNGLSVAAVFGSHALVGGFS
jgi:hypothetical protein